MAKKPFASSVRGKRAAKNERLMPDSRIDFSDIPESTGAELKRARRVGRPKRGDAKRLIAIRIAPRLLARIRRLAAKQSKPYQTLIHETPGACCPGEGCLKAEKPELPPDLVCDPSGCVALLVR
jgi:uncharacterized protein (DUF4415 family)